MPTPDQRRGIEDNCPADRHCLPAFAATGADGGNNRGRRMLTAPQMLTINQVADLLESAQHHTFTDRGATRFHHGQTSSGAPFLIAVNTADGLGFALQSGPRIRLAAANDNSNENNPCS